MQNKPYLSMLGLARRAGKLAEGHDMALESIRKRQAKLLLFTADASDRLEKEMRRAAGRYCPDLVCRRIRETMEELNVTLGCRAGVIAVKDPNFANRMTELINQEENVYGD